VKITDALRGSQRRTTSTTTSASLPRSACDAGGGIYEASSSHANLPMSAFRRAPGRSRLQRMTTSSPRTPVGRLIDQLRHRARPNHWSFLFGVITIACLSVLVATGFILMFLYDPSSVLVRYRGSYPLLRGVEISRACASMLSMSLDVPGGLLLRQAHHWAALVLPALLLLQLVSIFFTGAFRRPRQWIWVLLFGVYVLVLISGWSRYGLPDDNLSGTGLRIVQGGHAEYPAHRHLVDVADLLRRVPGQDR
jgi:quinol-cytochrome oxidoreductase complex cytochrome b subunit